MTRKTLITILLILSGTVLGLGSAVYSDDAVWFETFDKIDSRLWPNQAVLGKIRHRVGSFIDELNFLRGPHKILSSLDVYDLTLSPADVRRLLVDTQKEYESSGHKKPGAKFRKVVLRYKGGRHKAWMKLHGDQPNHWLGKKKSFQLKFAKDDFLERKRRLLFIIPEDRFYIAPLFINEVAKEMGLPYVENKFAVVRINSVFQGIYYVEEQVNKNFTEQNDISNGVVVQAGDNWIEDRRQESSDVSQYIGGITYNDRHATPFILEMSNLDKVKSEYAQTVYSKTNDLFDAIRRRDIPSFESLVDIRRTASMAAWCSLIGNTRLLVGDNLRMVYLLTAGRFVFIPRSEGRLNLLNYQGGSFEAGLGGKVGDIPSLYEMMVRSDEIRRLRNGWLYYFATHRKGLLLEFDRLRDEYLPLLKRDTTLPDSSREVDFVIKKTREALKGNLSRLKKQIEYAKIYVNALVNKNEIDWTLIPDSSFQEIRLKSLRVTLERDADFQKSKEHIQLFKYDERTGRYELLNSYEGLAPSNLGSLFAGERFGLEFDEKLRPQPKRYRYKIVFDDRKKIRVKSIAASFKTTLSKKIIPPDDVYLRVGDRTNDFSSLRFQTIPDFLARYPQFKWEVKGKELLLQPGSYKIDGNVIVPQGLKIIFEGGVELEMAPGAVFLSYSLLDIRGTKENPVQVRAENPDKPFGTFAIVGEEKGTVHVSYLNLSGGNEALLNGIFFSGALCVYHNDLKMDHSTIHHNHADDGLNVKYARIDIQDSRFVENFADQIDLDFCRGVISHSYFAGPTKIKGDPNGDGLDISGTNLFVWHSHFEHLPDKGVSVGEESNIILLDNQLIQNNIGVASKDLSSVLLKNNEISSNKIGLSAYRKKQIFGGGKIYLLANRLSRNGQDYKLDPFSKRYVPSSKGQEYFKTQDFDASSFERFDEILSEKNWSEA